MKNLVINQIINSKDFIMSPQELGTLGQKAQDHDANILSDFNDFVFLLVLHMGHSASVLDLVPKSL